MRFLTTREKAILSCIVEGMIPSDIAKELKASRSSVARSISNIEFKVFRIQKDFNFLTEIGYWKIGESGIEYLVDGPKDLLKKE